MSSCFKQFRLQESSVPESVYNGVKRIVFSLSYSKTLISTSPKSLKFTKQYGDVNYLAENRNVDGHLDREVAWIVT